MSTKSQYRDEEVGMFITSIQQESVFSVRHGKLTANWRYEIYSAIPDVRSRHTERSLGCLSACPRHRRDVESRWTAETASSLGAVGVVDVRRDGSRQSLMRDDRYFVLDALLDRQPLKRL